MNRLGLKTACVVVSAVIWMQVASTATVEQTVRLPLRVTGLQEGHTIVGSALPADVTVRLRGNKLRLLAHRYLNTPVGIVMVDLAERQPGRSFTVPVTVQDVVTELEVAQVIEPDRLTIRIDGEMSRRLPVSLSSIGSLPAGYGFLAEPRAEPDSVVVSGPARYFPERPVVRTAPFELARLEGSGVLRLRVLPPESHLSLSDHEVKVSYGIGLVAERTLADVVVRAGGQPGGAEVAVSPAHADVLVRGVADSLRVLAPGRVTVTVATAGLSPGVHLLPGEVTAPAWVTVIGLDPAQFQVISGPRPDPGVGGQGD